MIRDADPAAGRATNPEEQDLLRRLKAGDEGALARLMDCHGESLMQYLVSILRNRELAEDAFQDTWVRVARKAGEFELGLPFAPWLFRVARNRAYDLLRRRRRWIPLDEPVLRTRPDQAADGSASARRLVARDVIDRILPRLEADSREVIFLRFYRECSYEEIAEICGVPVGTVKSRLHRALDQLGRLHERLEEGFDDARGRA